MNSLRCLTPLLTGLVFWSTSCLSQTPPDSLLEKVILFKRPDAGARYQKEWNFPAATGFFLDTGDIKHAYIVTAKHVLRTHDSKNQKGLLYVMANGSQFSSHFRGRRHIVPQDSLLDVLVIDNNFGVQDIQKHVSHGFELEDIVVKSEYDSLQSGQDIFFIGMFPDSVKSWKNCYWVPSGKFGGFFAPPKTFTDSRTKEKFKVDFFANITGAPGISGSPVLMRKDSTFRVLGVVSAILTDSTDASRGVALCTAGYGIIEALETKWSLDRMTKEKEEDNGSRVGGALIRRQTNTSYHRK